MQCLAGFTRLIDSLRKIIYPVKKSIEPCGNAASCVVFRLSYASDAVVFSRYIAKPFANAVKFIVSRIDSLGALVGLENIHPLDTGGCRLLIAVGSRRYVCGPVTHRAYVTDPWPVNCP